MWCRQTEWGGVEKEEEVNYHYKLQVMGFGKHKQERKEDSCLSSNTMSILADFSKKVTDQPPRLLLPPPLPPGRP